MTSSDDVIERLRRENFDQFFTLVRMHLSFVVDINTDDVDCSTDKPKQFRWNFNRKAKSSNSSQNNCNNGKPNIEVNSITEEGIERLNELIDFLSREENVTQEGIFRRTGSLSRQQELRQLLISGSNLGLDEGRFSVHDCASVLKGFLADLPQPLLMDQYYQTYCTLASQYTPKVETSETKLLTALQLLLLLLSPSHRNFLQRLVGLLRLVADNEASNRMSPDTLATMFTPHLLCPRKLSPEAFHTESVALSPLISLMIRLSRAVFRAPAQLVTDATAYFAQRERKRVMSPDVDLDESVADKTAARTVFSFVDRPRSAQESARASTDAALATLYAHIHALPDSAHKRRLVKQFNRQNGYGTPIQIQRTGKVAGSRSFGDSIKRHIFNKGLLNKTPKKGSGSTISTVEEESIMTPRSRKPLIITSEQRDLLTAEVNDKSVNKSEKSVNKSDKSYNKTADKLHNKDLSDDVYRSMSHNDSDFVSSDDDRMSRSSLSCERSTNSVHPFDSRGDISPLRSHSTHFIISHERPNLQQDDLNTTLTEENLPQFKINHEVSEQRLKSLTQPFRDYLLSRSVLTATPIDLSILNKSGDDKLTDSLLYCLDGNIPSDLTTSINNLAVDNTKASCSRSPFLDVNKIDIDRSPNRKRSAKDEGVVESKKVMIDKENYSENNFVLRETDL